MFSAFKNAFNVKFSEDVNALIFFLRKIPLIGKKIPIGLYSAIDFKLTLGIFVQIFKFIFGIFGHALYIGLMVILPIQLITGTLENSQQNFVYILFILSYIFGPIVNSKIMDIRKKDFNMLVLMRQDPKEYFLSKVLFQNIIFFIQFFIALSIIEILLKYNNLAFALSFQIFIFKFIGEVLILHYFKKKGELLNKIKLYNYMILIIPVIIAYFPIAIKFQINLVQGVNNIITNIIAIVLGILSYRYLLRYNKYKQLKSQTVTKEVIFNFDETMKVANFADVQINEKNIKSEELKTEKYNSKEGYSYLNAIFFDRHKSIIITPVKIRLIIILLLTLIGITITIFFPESRNERLEFFSKITPVMVFVMYIISIGEKMCKAMFFNCDKSLLRYAYYKEGATILSNFKVRLKKMVTLNILPALAIILGISLVLIFDSNASYIIKLIPTYISILSLACFFSIHYLIMYYLLQPYTQELTVKSPMFSIINMVIYMIAYTCLRLESSSIYFAIGIISSTLIYMLIGLFITYKIAPKTFKLRN